MSKFTLEVCTDSVESAIAAKNGGANMIELCSNLVLGGTTPSLKLFEEVKKNVDIKINVLIRPRFGDFCYTDHEFEIIKEEIKMFHDMGADGIAVGILSPDGTLNMDQMKELMSLRGKMSVTLHRAFDMCSDYEKTLEQAILLQINNILTSGQNDDCLKGAMLLYELHKKAKGKIHIMAGGGVKADVIRKIYLRTGITTYHMSGKKVIDSDMTYRKDGVHMGLKEFSEYEIYRTDEEQIKEAVRVMNALK